MCVNFYCVTCCPTVNYMHFPLQISSLLSFPSFHPCCLFLVSSSSSPLLPSCPPLPPPSSPPSYVSLFLAGTHWHGRDILWTRWSSQRNNWSKMNRSSTRSSLMCVCVMMCTWRLVKVCTSIKLGSIYILFATVTYFLLIHLYSVA